MTSNQLEEEKWRNCRLTLKTPDYYFGWAVLAPIRLLDTHKRNFYFIQCKFSQPKLVWGFLHFLLPCFKHFHSKNVRHSVFLVNFVQGQPEVLGGSGLGEMISQKVFPREPGACLLKYFTFNDSKVRNNLLSQELEHQMLNSYFV